MPGIDPVSMIPSCRSTQTRLVAESGSKLSLSSPSESPQDSGPSLESLPSEDRGIAGETTLGADHRPPVGFMAALGELTKARLTALVVFTTAFGYLLAAPLPDARVFFYTVVGTTLAGASAAIFNQLWEIPWDRLMLRTRHRPLVTGQISRKLAWALGLGFGVGGVLLLFFEARVRSSFGVSPAWPAFLALGTLLGYILIYTPLKRHTSLNTIVGAVTGAMPPLIGWTAATGELSYGGWTLFAILFFWQIPHFLAIDWKYREDYARGGFRMLSVVDPSGRASGRMSVQYTLALIGVSLTPSLCGVSGAYYLIAAPVLGLLMLLPARKFARDPQPETARRLFIASLIYLPLLFGVMLLDRSSLSDFVRQG